MGDVTVQTPDGKRHTITVESESVYHADIQFFGRAGASFPGDSELPKTDNDTVFKVRPIYRVPEAKLMEWANKKANIYARSSRCRCSILGALASRNLTVRSSLTGRAGPSMITFSENYGSSVASYELYP